MIDWNEFGTIVATVIIYGLWGYTLMTGKDTTGVNEIVAIVTGYWFGSSYGSKKKTDAQIRMNEAAAPPRGNGL